MQKSYDFAEKGLLHFWPDFLEQDLASAYYNELLGYLDWQQERIRLFGKTHNQPRLTAWMGRGLSAYSNYSEEISAQPWTEKSSIIREEIEHQCSSSFNSVLANYYRNGADYMGFHADDEKVLGTGPSIASLSLGAERKFVIKNKNDKKTVLEIHLNHGSLLLMTGGFQHHFKHGIPKTKKVSEGRINLTYRHLKLASPQG